MVTAILAIILFCIMIFPHELGHFIVAKLVGVQVNEFAFGMGPVIWKKQRGETLHTIRLFPIGGFCAMEGEDGEEDDEPLKKKTEKDDDVDADEDNEEDENVIPIIEHNPRALCNKKPGEKIAVLCAGSVMNMICAFIIMTLVVGIMGFTTTTLGEISADSPAEAAGLEVGDKVISMDILDEDGKVVSSNEIKQWPDVSVVIQESKGSDIAFNVKRGKEDITKVVTPMLTDGYDAQGNPAQGYVVGIVCAKGHNPLKAIVTGAESTWNLTKLMFESLRMIFTGEVGVKEMSGPVGMVQMVSETSNYGLWYFGFLVALISVNLAVINMLPLPALDGGRIIFVLWTLITGKPVSAKVEGTVHAIGLILLLALMIYVTGFDIARIFGK